MKTFSEIRKDINVYTAVDDNRLRILYDKVKETENIHGAMAEVGVYKGGSAYLIANTCPDKILFACDTFTGLPESTEQDQQKNGTHHNAGDFSDLSVTKVREFLNDRDRIKLLVGLFPKETAWFLESREFSFVHIDVDLYRSTKDCLEFFYPRMSKGGIIVSDDYKWKDTPGVETAFNEFMVDKPEKLIDTGFNSCYFVKE